ncbi:MAG: leucine-rich repeat protein [Clostridia bacterium]|nr:leucine-rich repeat protein [Clostridia bacterium]
MKKNIFALLAKKKALVISVASVLTLGIVALIIILCLPSPEQPEPPKPEAVTYTVSFDSNEGSEVDSIEVEENTKIVLENYVTTKTDAYFYAWCFDEELTQRAPATITVTSDMTLYAEWGVEELYLLSFETGAGTKIESVQYAPNAYLAIPEDPTRENYSFGGWYKDEACTKAFTFFGAQMPKKNFTVYAKWNTLHGILFNSNGGSEVAPIFGEAGDPVSEPQAPTKTDYVFDGWYKDAACTQAYEIVTIPSNVITVYAGWHEQAKNIDVTLYLNHSSVATTSVKVTGNEGEQLNDAETIATFTSAVTEALKEQCLGVSNSDLESAPIYNLSAWAFDEKGANRFDGTLPYAQKIDLYAVWTRSTAYCQVSFVGETNSYFVKKNTAIPATTITPILDAAKAQYEEIGCTVDGFYTVGGNRYQVNEPVSMDMNLMPYVYSANLTYSLIQKENGKGSKVDGYALTGYDSAVAEEYKAKDSLLLLVPDYFNGKPVIWVNDKAFAGFPVNEVTLPSGLLGIGTEAFSNTKLTKITIPSSVYVLGDNAFSGSTALAAITIKGQITSIGVTVFNGAAYESQMPRNTDGFIFFDENQSIVYRYVGTVESVWIPDSATTIGGGAFRGNTTLKTVTFHDNVRSVSDYAFENTALQTVKIGKFFANMGKGIFKDSTSLETITFASKYNLSYIGESMFEGCSSLTTVNVSELQNLQTINDSAFKGCTSLKGISFPDALKSVGKSSFEGCTALEYADLGKTDVSKFEKLNDRAFANCTSLRRIILRGELINNKTVTFGAEVLKDSGYTKNTVFTPPVIYVKDKWVDNWGTSEDLKTQSYVQIYEQKFKNTEYKNIVIKPIDSKVPNLNVNGELELSRSQTPSIAAFDLLAYLKSSNIYTVTDDTECTVYIKSVATQRGMLQSVNGKYNLNGLGAYLITIVAEDECLNVSEAQVVLTVVA